MKFEGLFLIVAGLYVLIQEKIYDSTLGVEINLEIVKYPLGIGLILAGAFLLSRKKQDKSS